MLHHIKGLLVEINPTHAIVECAGLGYEVHISLHTFTSIQGQGEVLLYLYPIYKEDSQTLYGFAEKQEREIFTRLISVSGVGGNTARTILSSLSPSETVEAITGNHVASLQAVKGIGAKTAQRIIVDLRDKMGSASLAGESLAGGSDLIAEALAALEVLGYSPKQTERVLLKLRKENPQSNVEQLIKAALKSL